MAAKPKGLPPSLFGIDPKRIESKQRQDNPILDQKPMRVPQVSLAGVPDDRS
jgi:hypothetical protein